MAGNAHVLLLFSGPIGITTYQILRKSIHCERSYANFCVQWNWNFCCMKTLYYKSVSFRVTVWARKTLCRFKIPVITSDILIKQKLASVRIFMKRWTMFPKLSINFYNFFLSWQLWTQFSTLKIGPRTVETCYSRSGPGLSNEKKIESLAQRVRKLWAKNQKHSFFNTKLKQLWEVKG